MKKNTKKMTPKQNRNLHRLYCELGFDEEMRRDVCELVVGERSMRSSSRAKATKLIQELMRRAGELPADGGDGPVRKYKHPAAKEQGDPNSTITEAQKMVLAGWFNFMGADTAKARADFCKRQIKKPWPHTVGEAQKMIESLKKMHKERPDYRFGGGG